MIHKDYYYLIAGLPDLIADDKKIAFSTVEFREMMRENLSNAHFELAMLYYLPYDHKNLLNFLFKKGADWDERGNFSNETIEIIGDRKSFELSEDVELPSYIHEFLTNHYGEESFKDYYTAELSLTSGYYEHLSKNSNRFVSANAEFNKKVSNVMTAFSGRKHEIKYENNLIGDDEVTNAIKRSRARDFGLSSEFPEIETLAQIYETENFVDREFKLDLFKWQFLDEATVFNYFSIEKILAYIQKLFIVERWYGLDKDKGRLMFNKILEELKSGFHLPDEYTITYGKKK